MMKLPLLSQPVLQKLHVRDWLLVGTGVTGKRLRVAMAVCNQQHNIAFIHQGHNSVEYTYFNRHVQC